MDWLDERVDVLLESEVLDLGRQQGLEQRRHSVGSEPVPNRNETRHSPDLPDEAGIDLGG